MQMEVDIPSPSPSLRSKYKRARSPDDMGSPSRPAKRVITSQDERRQLFPILTCSGSSRRSTPEDWVQQASGLTITTPVSVDSGRFESGFSVGVDFDNGPGTSNPPVPSKPQLPPLRTSFETTQTAFTNHNAPMDDIEQPAPTPAPIAQPIPSNPPLRPFPYIPPAISVQPPTPDIAVHQPAFTRSASPYSDSSMSISNSPIAFIGSPLRRKFTMGPRADCEKCRLGVKGHSVHLD
ncbi:hypothetical protein V5O48_001768 [Marasmius crinis-equi]|uniref:Uncharacterized protein n=1 Tax=Marasmius crinis-equi TaxID=585013 RepID=A0ABR3FY22_9AGAR